LIVITLAEEAVNVLTTLNVAASDAMGTVGMPYRVFRCEPAQT